LDIANINWVIKHLPAVYRVDFGATFMRVTIELFGRKKAFPESLQYRHFSPLVSWKGSNIILSTHNLSLYPEHFTLDSEIRMLFLKIETINATEGNVELSALVLPATITERDLMTNNPGTSQEKPGCYSRRYSEIDVEIRHLDQLENIRKSVFTSLVGLLIGSQSREI